MNENKLQSGAPISFVHLAQNTRTMKWMDRITMQKTLRSPQTKQINISIVC